MNICHHFKLKPQDGDWKEGVEALLAEHLTFVAEAPTSTYGAFYDSFDWRLFNKSLILQQSGTEAILRQLKTGKSKHTFVMPSEFRFPGDLPESDIRSRLQAILEVRALLKLVDYHLSTSNYRILNEDEKTVARLVYTELRLTSDETLPASAAYVSLQPVRGYPRYVRLLAELFADAKPLSSLDCEIYWHTLKAVGQNPGSYSSKSKFQLMPKMRSDDAAKIILRQMWETMQANEDGIRADIDSEYLHDYRIAVRRTRSALGQIKGIFADKVTQRFRQDFRELGKRSNMLRDLDVYLLAESDYRAMLSPAVEADIAPLFVFLRSQRKQALAEVVAGLDSAEYSQFQSDWVAFLDAPVGRHGGGKNAAEPVINLARRRIYRQYQRIVKDGTAILHHTEDELLHALRIECKRLRYLLEFFESLFRPKEMARLIKELKRLQDNLGNFTDLAVQQEHLLSIAADLPIENPQSRRALIATGILVEKLAHDQARVKTEFAATFTAFASPANQKHYRQLFAKKGRVKKS